MIIGVLYNRGITKKNPENLNSNFYICCRHRTWCGRNEWV